MQSFRAILAAYCIVSVISLTVPDQASIPAGNNLSPPPPSPGESVDDWLLQLFGPLDNTSSKASNVTLHARSNNVGDYREYAGIHELTWTNDTTDTSYNISVDFSKSCTGLSLNDTIGVYTFTNGTTTNDTKLQDMIADIWSLRPTQDDPRRRLANHTATLAQLAVDEGEALASQLICPSNQSATAILLQAAGSTTNGGVFHDELRKLLSTSRSYWTIFILSVTGGAGLGAAGAAGVQRAMTGEVSPENVIQTAVVIGSLGMLAGILNRLHELGMMERWIGSAGLFVRENVAQQVSIAVEREVNRRVADFFEQRRRQSIAGHADGWASHDAAGFSTIDGQTTPDSLGGTRSGPGTPRRGSPACLPSKQALASLDRINEIESRRYRMEPFGKVMEWERSRLDLQGLAEEGRAGPSESNCPVWSDPSSDTQEPTGEMSAADLVQVENMALAADGNAGSFRYNEAGSNGGWSNTAASNGGQSDGEQSNGAVSNGGATNGGQSNGAASNGGQSNGGGIHGAASNGAASNGATSNGAASNGAASNGAVSNGAASNGAASNGAASNGVTSNGATSNGGGNAGINSGSGGPTDNKGKGKMPGGGRRS